jgi:hypothetical protein
VDISSDTIIKCNYKLCAKVDNKSNVQSETLSRVTHTCETGVRSRIGLESALDHYAAILQKEETTGKTVKRTEEAVWGPASSCRALLTAAETDLV